MTQQVTIGTAGHVDHGKTALVKAITGVDTDRWEEEKRRGITIDLGFAALELGDGVTVSVVDVPGHEDFVRNMVAGATGIDVALLVVAADEGIMPQTEEHLSILEFLAVKAGVVALTKVDLPDAEWTALVEADVRDRLDRSTIAWSVPVRTSVTDDTGFQDLRVALAEAAHKAVTRRADDLFRMPVDRSFSVAGAGTVVTGTTWSGSVAVGDEVRLLPQDVRGRVRGIQVHGEDRARAVPGRRTALALAGVRKDEVPRGTVAVTDIDWQPTRAIDVMLTLLPNARPVTQRSRIRIHIGTAEVFARVTPAKSEIAPGTEAAARLRLEEPLLARWGDRGIVRSYSPVTTVGGCVVVDPEPASRPRRPVDLHHRTTPDPAARITAAVRVAGRAGIAIASLPTRLGILPSLVESTVEDACGSGVVRVGEHLYAHAIVDDARTQALATLRTYHEAHPLETGMPLELLRAAIEPVALGSAVADLLAADGVIAYDAGTARLEAFRAELDGTQTEAAETMERELSRRGAKGATLGELAVDYPKARELAEFLTRTGRLARIGNDRYYTTAALQSVQLAIVDSIRQTDGASPSELRDATGLTRKYLIPILEWMDARGYTRREGNDRVLGPRSSPAGGGS